MTDKPHPNDTRRETVLDSVLADIDEWWQKLAHTDIERTLDKARDYDGIDLEIMGKAMESLLPASSELSPQERTAVGLEMACAFYLMGKAARLFGSYRRGSVPKDDHWFDARVYTVMAQRIRQTGRWT